MNAIEAVTERSRIRTTTDWHICKTCAHSYDDVEEGWNCRKFDAVITLSSGTTLDWPGQACDRAFSNDCRGDGYERATFWMFKRIPFWSRMVVTWLLACAVLVLLLVWLRFG